MKGLLIKAQNHNALTVQRKLEMAGNMDSELLLKFNWVFPKLPFGIVTCTFTLFFRQPFIETAASVSRDLTRVVMSF